MAKLPGLGPRSARRVLLYLLKDTDQRMIPLGEALRQVSDQVKICGQCGYVDEVDPCSLCQNTRRKKHMICVVSDVSDVWAFERSGFYAGQYHVLGGTLSVMGGITPDTLNIPSLLKRTYPPVTEVILALNATVSGQTTAFYLSKRLQEQHSHIKITTLARGIPLGGEVDYLDDGTLMTAFTERLALPLSEEDQQAQK